MRTTIGDVASFGIVRDIPAHRLTPGAWSDGRGFRFTEGVAVTFSALAPAWALDAGPRFIAPIRTASSRFWLYADLNRVYSTTDGAASQDITRASGPYSANDAIGWHAPLFQGTPVLNNGVDVPQVLTPVDPGTVLVDLPNWPAQARARIIRALGGVLVGMNIADGASDFPNMVWWSNATEPGSVPPDWDYADRYSLSGRDVLVDDGGNIVDAALLGRSMMIYKEHSTWRMTATGGRYVMATEQAFSQLGALGEGCATPFSAKGGTMHAVFGDTEMVIHNGASVERVAQSRLNSWVYGQIAGGYAAACFTAVDPIRHEVLFCFPEAGEKLCTLAAVWNYYDNTMAIRELPQVSSWGIGAFDLLLSSDSWDAGPDVAWDDDDKIWDENVYENVERRLVLATPNEQGVRVPGIGPAASASYLERRDLTFSTREFDASQVDKHVSAIYPRVKFKAGGSITIQVGSALVPDGPIEWGQARTFSEGDEKVDTRVDGKYIAIRLSVPEGVGVALSGMDAEVFFEGSR